MYRDQKAKAVEMEAAKRASLRYGKNIEMCMTATNTER